ncbi:MAG: NdvB protein, partial [Pseudomonadota bacterium]
PDGGMPEGVLLDGNGALKYINQIPHTDHCVWLPICLQAYLSETADYAFLAHRIAGSADGKTSTVHERITHAMQWLIANRNERHLSLIAQGDWCDPMNMVGHRGDGVSGWLSIATVHALNLWREICDRSGHGEIATDMHTAARQSADAVQAYLWQEPWFARGITDDGRTFGTIDDSEGSLFLNPQTWAIIAGIANDQQQQTLIDAIESRLTTPYGVMLLAPSFTHMHEDIGRLTQKFPGTAENGSVYNHAAMFYVYALFQRRKSELAFAHLRRALPSLDPDDLRQRGQLPVFIPNYYRGAYREHPRTAGRSSQLFHTGAASWMYRIVIEQLFGLRGCDDGLLIDPQLPAVWDSARIERTFRGAQFHVTYERCANLDALSVEQDKTVLSDNIIRNVRDGNEYQITVKLPMVSP